MTPVAPNLSIAASDACRWRLSRALLWITVAVIGASWMSTASASCGHYLYRNGNPVNDVVVNVQDSTPTVAEEQTPLENPVHRCSGPNCSQTPVPLNPTPAAPVNLISGFDQLAVLQSLCRPAFTRSAVEIPESERGAHFEPSAIFRPPMA